MIGFLIISIILIFVAEMVFGWLWYSFLFQKRFMELLGAKPEDGSSSEQIKGSFKKQMIGTFIKAVWLTFIVLFLPKTFVSFIVLLLIPVVFPLIQYMDNIWVKRKSWALVWFDSWYIIAAYAISALIALILKLWLV